MAGHIILKVFFSWFDILYLLPIDIKAALLYPEDFPQYHGLLLEFLFNFSLDSLVVSGGQDILVVFESRLVRSVPYFEIDLFLGEPHLLRHVVFFLQNLWVGDGEAD